MNSQQQVVVVPDADATTLSRTADSNHERDEATDSNPFSCNICKRSYTRVDHLARHYRSHTREKPFSCDVCHKSFARVDLLKRHTNSHSQSNGSQRPKSAAPPSHSRVSKACIACAESKLRCNGALPCGRCKNRDLHCEYGRSRPRKSTTAQRQHYEGPLSLSSESVPPTSTIQSAQNQYQNSNVSVSTPEQQPDASLLMMNSIITDSWSNEPSAVTSSDHNSMQQSIPATFDETDPIDGAIDLTSGITGQIGMPSGSSFADNESLMRFDDLPLIDFLRTVITPVPLDTARPPDIAAFRAFPRDLLDFNVDQPLETDWTHFAPDLFVPDQFASSSAVRFDVDESLPHKDGSITPGNVLRASFTLGQQAFKDSVWLWTPKLGDRGGKTDQAYLESVLDHSKLGFNDLDAKLVQEQLSLAMRDRILAMVLSTTDAASTPLIVARFPPPELLTKLLNVCLIDHLRGGSTWIHPATLNFNEEAPEFLAAMIATGAIGCGIPDFRKLGLAFQEAVRIALPERFEGDNRTTRNLRHLQAYALHLNVALWSGDRRRMEIAESFSQPLITMMRRAGHFRRHEDAGIVPDHGDDEGVIDSKWNSWAEAESFKRLALHLFLRDTQTSISLLNQPLISYAELSLDLPCSDDLWMAKTGSEWKDLYLLKLQDAGSRHISIRQCINDTTTLFSRRHIVDVQLAMGVILSSIWALIWQCRKMREILNLNEKDNTRSDSLAVSSLHQETLHLIQHLTLNATEWEGGMKPEATLLRELCLMHLHVSLEDVQRLAGKEGEEEARGVFPQLKAWAKSTESRRSVFHAGQVMRAAKNYLPRTLREASAVAVYHASLAFWAYAIFSNRLSSTETIQTGLASHTERLPHDKSNTSFVRLDIEDGPEIQRFLVLGKGVPCIRHWGSGDDAAVGEDVPLTDPVRIMKVMTDLLRTNNGGNDRNMPPLVMNLSKLMSSLGSAAASGRRK